MKQLKCACSAFFISFEFLVLLGGILAGVWLGKREISGFAGIELTDEKIKYLGLIPVVSFAWVFKEGRTILFPPGDKKQILCDWPDYWQLEIIFKVALANGVIFAVLGILAWLYKWNPPQGSAIILLVVGVLGSLINTYTVYNAQIQVNKILIQRKN